MGVLSIRFISAKAVADQIEPMCESGSRQNGGFYAWRGWLRARLGHGLFRLHRRQSAEWHSTDDLQRRVWEHKEADGSRFTVKYGCKILVWYAVCEGEAALILERRMKEWKRAWKLRAIEERNPEWVDLYETLNQ
jgi:putative endonuclease